MSEKIKHFEYNKASKLKNIFELIQKLAASVENLDDCHEKRIAQDNIFNLKRTIDTLDKKQIDVDTSKLPGKIEHCISTWIINNISTREFDLHTKLHEIEIDSLDIVELLIHLEVSLDISIDDSKLTDHSNQTIGELVNSVVVASKHVAA